MSIASTHNNDQEYDYFMVLAIKATCNIPQCTGITQAMVDKKPTLVETFEKLDKWIKYIDIDKPDNKYIFVTCGDWDLKTMLPKQCKNFELISPTYLKKWLDMKQAFEEVTCIKPRKKDDLVHMLEVMELPLEMHYQNGIDDCKNIANILRAIAKTGYVFKETGRLD